MKKIHFTLLFMLLCQQVFAQSITISPGTDENPAMISTNNDYQRGYKIPTMTTIERLNIEKPVDGLTVFDTDRKSLCSYYNSVWYCPTKDVIEDRKPQIVFASDSSANDGFGDAVDIAGNFAAIGAPTAEVNANTNQRAVYLFSYNPSTKTWIQSQKLVASDGQANDNFGTSVVLTTDYLIVGATGTNSNTGSVYVFRKISGVWTQEAKIVPSDGATSDRFGTSIDFIINTTVTPNVPMILIASSGDDLVSPSVSNIGSAYLFSFNSATLWTLTQKVMDTSGFSSDGSGITVKFKDHTQFVIAKTDADNGTAFENYNRGKVSIYRNTGSGFGAIQTFMGTSINTFLGSDIEISGDYMVVGERINSPKLYKYNTSSNQWSLLLTIGSPDYDTYFGATFAIAGDKIFIRDTYQNYGVFFKISSAFPYTSSYQTIGVPNFCYHVAGGRITAIENGLYVAGEGADACTDRAGRVAFGEYNNSF